MRNILRQSYS